MPSLQPLLARPFPYNDDPVSTTALLDSFDQLSCMLAVPRIRRGSETYIRILESSPPDANMQGFVGFHATALQHEGVCASSFSMRAPVSLCHMYMNPSVTVSS